MFLRIIAASLSRNPRRKILAGAALAIGMAGNIRGQTLRAFDKEEMAGILQKLA